MILVFNNAILYLTFLLSDSNTNKNKKSAENSPASSVILSPSTETVPNPFLSQSATPFKHSSSESTPNPSFRVFPLHSLNEQEGQKSAVKNSNESHTDSPTQAAYEVHSLRALNERLLNSNEQYKIDIGISLFFKNQKILIFYFQTPRKHCGSKK